MEDGNKIEFNSWTLSLIVNILLRTLIIGALFISFIIITSRIRTSIQLNELKKRIAHKNGTKSPVLVIGFFHPNW